MADRCWCGGELGPRVPGDAQGLGCLDDINHDWTSPEQCSEGVYSGTSAPQRCALPEGHSGECEA